MESLVAINIFVGKDIINHDGVPLLFYWDGETDVSDSISHDAEFIEWCRKNSGVLSVVNEYTSARLAFFYFTNKDGNEECINYAVSFQDMFSLDTLESMGNDGETEPIINYIITPSLSYLYKLSFNGELEVDTKTPDYINDVYRKIKDKYKERLTKETFINGARNFYKTQMPELNGRNTEFILSYIDKHIATESLWQIQ